MAGDEKGGSASGDGDSIRVIIRVRPGDADADNNKCLDVDNSNHAIRMLAKPEPKVFTFDQVCDINTTQESVFRSVGKKVIDTCVAGYNGTVFAYGQTGSGKTFTMLGPSEDTDNFQHELRGVIPRSFEYLFSLIKTELDMHGDKVQFLCKCSFLEIYNENVYDLLDAASRGLQLRENIKKGVFVDGIIENAVTNSSEAYDVLAHGWTNRTVASTSMNRESSRSHAVFTVHIESKKLVNGVWNVRSSQLNLVDLAGSERQKDANTAGVRLKEAGNINKSLSALGNVIMALVDICHGKTRHVPYRDSKLSFLLRDSLGGNAKTSIIACVHPGSKCFGETLSTLHFARRAKMIKNKAVVNEDMQGSITHLQAEIKRLKEQIQAYEENGNLPQEMGPGGGDADSALPNKEGGVVDGRYKQFFIDAMVLKQRADATAKKFWSINQQKDRALRQNKMVLKFREESIKKLEKVVKEKNGVMDNDTMNGEVERLTAELTRYKEFEQHNPEVTKYKMEAEHMKREMQKLRCIDNKVITEMEEEVAKEQAEAKKNNIGTPSQANEKTALTIEKQKEQIAKLHEEVENQRRLKQQLQDEFDKEKVGLHSEIESLRAANEELKKINESARHRYKVEREARDDMHADTIKKMSTPQKAKYKLRNRIILGPSSASSTPQPQFLDDSNILETSRMESEEVEEGILDMTAPQQLLEGQIEALQDDFSKLQDELRNLTEQLAQKDDKVLQLVQDSSKLGSEKKQLEEMLEKRQMKSEEEAKTIKDAHNKLLGEFQKIKSDYEFASSHASDLEIMFASSDKKHAEVVQEFKDKISSKEKALNLYTTQVMKLEVAKEHLERDLSTSKDSVEKLQESEETLQATLDFTQGELSKAEDHLKKMKTEKQQLQLDIKTLEEKLASEQERCQQVKEQLSQQEGALQKQLVDAMSKIESKENELEEEKLLLKDARNRTVQLEEQLKAKQHEIEKHIKTEQELKDGLHAATKQLTESKDTCQQHQHALENSQTQLLEIQAECSKLEDKLQGYESANLLVKDEMEQLELSLQQKSAELETADMDMDQYIEINGQLEQSKQELDNQVLSLKGTVEKTGKKLSDAKCEFEELQVSQTDLKATCRKLEEYNKQVNSKNDQLEMRVKDYSSKVEELEDKNKVLNEKTAEYKDLLEQIRNAALSTEQQQTQAKEKLQEKYETESNEKDEEIKNLTRNIDQGNEKVLHMEDDLHVREEQLAKSNKNLAEVMKTANDLDEKNHALNALTAEQKKKHSALKVEHEQAQEELRSAQDISKQLENQLSFWKDKFQEKQDEMVSREAELENAIDVTNKLQGRISELKEAVGKWEERFAPLQQEKTDLSAELNRLQQVIREKDENTNEQNSKHMQIEELYHIANKQFEELKVKHNEIMEENARLVGHQNPKQKIQHINKIKEENRILSEHCASLEKELAIAKLELRGEVESSVRKAMKSTPAKATNGEKKPLVTPAKSEHPGRATVEKKAIATPSKQDQTTRPSSARKRLNASSTGTPAITPSKMSRITPTKHLSGASKTPVKCVPMQGELNTVDENVEITNKIDENRVEMIVESGCDVVAAERVDLHDNVASDKGVDADTDKLDIHDNPSTTLKDNMNLQL